MNNENNGKCGCTCHKYKGLKGILIALIGLTFLLSNLGVLSAQVAGIIWPVLVIIFGIKKMSSICKCCDKAGM